MLVGENILVKVIELICNFGVIVMQST